MSIDGFEWDALQADVIQAHRQPGVRCTMARSS